VSSVGTKSASTTADSGSDASLPLSVETLDAPGSSAGEALVPTPNTVTVVDLFATWCAPCDEQVAELRAIHDEYESVSFVSVTNERPSDTLTREDIAAWWEENDGAWTLGIDPGSDLLRAFGATGLPYIAITNERGEVVTDHSGLATADTLRSEIDAVVK
jgi:thiol-disulfide isomerase/thioredoxin